MKKDKISALIPTFNNEGLISKAIKSVEFADEILIIDSYSTDKTLEIAKSLGTKIIQQNYKNSASQKNWAIPQAKYDWILLLDSDEIISYSLKKEVLEVLSKKRTESAYWIYRENYFLGKKVNYSGWQKDKVIRLFNKNNCRYQQKSVHSEIETEGKIGFLKEKIIHHTYKSFSHYLLKIERYAKWQSEDLYKKNQKIWVYHFIFKPQFRFIKHYFINKGFLDGRTGLIISAFHCYGVFLRYFYLLKLKIQNEGGNLQSKNNS